MTFEPQWDLMIRRAQRAGNFGVWSLHFGEILK